MEMGPDYRSPHFRPSILYEDNHLLVAVKPPNVPTQEDESRDPDFLNLLKLDLKERYAKPGNVYLGLVHRLDRPVGGVMVFAKTSKAASRLSEAVRTHAVSKQYAAVVHGQPSPAKAQLIDYLLKDSKTNTVTVVSSRTTDAKQAILNYELAGSHHDLSLVRIELITGRSHQIRVQFSHINCPLWGDQRYGQTMNHSGQQIALWATQLTFPHPTNKEIMVFQSAPPSVHPWILWEPDHYQ